MKQVTIRVEMRVSEQMSEYLLDEAHSKKLSYEGLLLSYIEDRMNRSLQEMRHTRPR
jgi:hypothetical protein